MEVSASTIKLRLEELRRNVQRFAHKPIAEQQRLSLIREVATTSNCWTLQTTISAVDHEVDGIEDVIQYAFEKLRQQENGSISIPSTVDLSVEWTIFGDSIDDTSAPSESVFEIESRQRGYSTILYVYGGIFFMNKPASRRAITQRLSEVANARCVTPQYRLCPQSPFPAALIDILHCYLGLLYPPSGSLHSAIDCSKIVLAGDSGGASLILSLVQLILATQRAQSTLRPKVRFGGADVVLYMPAGALSLSAALDHALSLPSFHLRAQVDLVTPQWPYLDPGFPACEIWPSQPPREHLLCPASLLNHPLVSPCTAVSWSGSPPLWFANGEEAFADSALIVAKAAAQVGVAVSWTEFEKMPHIWPVYVPRWWQSVDVLKQWGIACRDMLEQKVKYGYEAHRIKIDRRIQDIDLMRLTMLKAEEASKIIMCKASSMPIFKGKTMEPKL